MPTSPKHEIKPYQSQPKKRMNNEHMYDIILKEPIVINLDSEDEESKIEEQVYNELSLLFFKSMDLDGGNNDDSLDESDPLCVEIRATPCKILILVPLVYYPPSIYDEKDWYVDDFP